jgi:hypothetical protein
MLDHQLTEGRTRTLARYACLLEATHQPELRTILAHGVASRAAARALLAGRQHARTRSAGETTWWRSWTDCCSIGWSAPER